MDSSGHVTDDTGKVAPGTSPSIAAVGSNAYVIAFVNTADRILWVKIGDSAPVRFGAGLAVAPGPSPSIAGDLDGEWEAAFQAANGDITRINTGGDVSDTGISMAAATSPAITELPSGASGTFEVAYQAAAPAASTPSSPAAPRSTKPRRPIHPLTRPPTQPAGPAARAHARGRVGPDRSAPRDPQVGAGRWTSRSGGRSGAWP